MKIDVVTITKDNDSKLDLTINSINNVFLKNHLKKIVIVDGGAGSSSQEWRQKDPRIELIKEPDSGIFDAMNKGWLSCESEWVIFMNSGDQFEIHVDIEQLIFQLSNSSAQWAVGASLLEKSNGEIDLWSPHSISKWKFSRAFNSYPHQATFYNKLEVQDKQLFRSQSKVADWEKSLQLFQVKKPLILNQVISRNEPFESSASLSVISWCREVVESRAILGICLLGSKSLDFTIQIVFKLIQKAKTRFSLRSSGVSALKNQGYPR